MSELTDKQAFSWELVFSQIEVVASSSRASRYFIVYVIFSSRNTYYIQTAKTENQIPDSGELMPEYGTENSPLEFELSGISDQFVLWLGDLRCPKKVLLMIVNKLVGQLIV